MAYTIVSDVESEFKNQSFGSADVVSSGEVAEFITQEENIINAKLGQVYVTPITNSTDVSICKKIVIWIVKHRIQEIMKLRSGTDLDSEDQSNLEDKANKLLDHVIEKKLLHNSTRLGTNNAGIEDFNDANSIDPAFDMTDGGNDNSQGMDDVDFW